MTAKMPKLEKFQKISKNAIDVNFDRRERGRPRKCQYSEILGRADNYRSILAGIWPKVSGPLLIAKNEDEVTDAFRSFGKPYENEFVPRLAGDILSVIREKKFPKKPKTQAKFLANSLAGIPNVVPRTSRDICAKGLAKEKAKSPHKILRKEYYIECSCGFKGPARNSACRKCGAEISPFLDSFPGFETQ